MSQARMPTLFVSHGAPTVALIEDEYSASLEAFGKTLDARGCRAIVILSAHWVTPGPVQIGSHAHPPTVHDFHGFQKELYDIQYPAPGSPELAQEIVVLLGKKKISSTLNPNHGFDHGVWIPLRLLRPNADLPVIQISLPITASPREVLQLGNALASLREKGVLIVGSGGAVHNLSSIRWDGRMTADKRSLEFDTWLKRNLIEANIEELLGFDENAPHSEFAHPTHEHLMPLFFSIGATLSGDQVQIVHEGFQYGSLSMLSFALETGEAHP